MRVNIRLNLPKSFNKLVLRYNTFEKVSYDKYFIASLVKHTRNNLDNGYNIINELTGKGSLNKHFVNLYDEIRELSDLELDGILKDSLYPIQKIEEFRYTFFPQLNISSFKKNIYEEDLKDNDLIPKQLVDKNGTYISHEYIEGEIKNNSDNYDVELSEKEIKIKIYDSFYPISNKDFESIRIEEKIDLTKYQGEIHQSISGEGWIQLNNSTLNNILNTNDYYYDSNGDHIGIYNDNAKKTIIGVGHGIYFVKEHSYKYSEPANKEICEKAIKILMETGRINEIKNKTIVDMLRNVNRDLEQEAINYILSKKDVKELALSGIKLIEKGYEKNWNLSSLESFYKFKETPRQLFLIYNVNDGLNYSIDDLLSIYKLDKTSLNIEHSLIVENYFKDIEAIKDNITSKIGTIMLSGIREKIGKMKLDEDSKKLRKFLNSIAHYNKDIQNKSLNELIDYQTRVDNNMDLFERVQKKLEENKEYE